MGTVYFDSVSGRHEFSDDHLAKAYHNGLCSVGASVTRIALETPS
jgi:hypothetical protein